MNGSLTLARKMSTGLTPNKDTIRSNTIHEILNFITSNGITRQRFLTLPSAFWKFEKEIYSKLKQLEYSNCKFTACERDYQVFKIAATRMMRGNYTWQVKWIDDLECEMVTNGKTCKLFNIDVFKFLEGTDSNRLTKYPDSVKESYNIIWLDTMSPVSYLIDKLPSVLNYTPNGPSMIIITVLKGREHKSISGTRTEVISKCFPGYNLVKSWEYMDSCPMLQLMYSNVEQTNFETCLPIIK